MVPKEEWEHYIDEGHRHEMVCKKCWQHIKRVIDRNAQM